MNEAFGSDVYYASLRAGNQYQSIRCSVDKCEYKINLHADENTLGELENYTIKGSVLAMHNILTHSNL